MRVLLRSITLKVCDCPNAAGRAMRRVERRGWAILIFIIPAKAGSQRAEVATGFPLGSDDDDPATVGSRPLVRRLAGERMRSMAQADFNALWIAGSMPRVFPACRAMRSLQPRDRYAVDQTGIGTPLSPGPIPRPQSEIGRAHV